MGPFTFRVLGNEYTFDPADIEVAEDRNERVDLITVKKAAERFGVTPPTVRRWLQAGKVEGERDKWTGFWYVNREAEPPAPTSYGRPRGPWVRRTHKRVSQRL